MHGEGLRESQGETYYCVIVLLCRVVLSTSEMFIEKNSELFSLSCQHLNVTCDGHVIVTTEVQLICLYVYCVEYCVLGWRGVKGEVTKRGSRRKMTVKRACAGL